MKKITFCLILILRAYFVLANEIERGTPVYGRVTNGVNNSIVFKIDKFNNKDFKNTECEPTEDELFVSASYSYIGREPFHILLGDNMYEIDYGRPIYVSWKKSYDDEVDCNITRNTLSENDKRYFFFFNPIFNYYTTSLQVMIHNDVVSIKLYNSFDERSKHYTGKVLLYSYGNVQKNTDKE